MYGCVSSPLLFDTFGVALVKLIAQHSTVDPAIISDLVYLDSAPKNANGNLREKPPLESAREAIWGALYADYVVTEGNPGVTRLTCSDEGCNGGCEIFGSTVSENEMDSASLWSVPSSPETARHVQAAGRRYERAAEFVYANRAVSEDANISIEIMDRIGAAWASFRKYRSKLYDRSNAQLSPESFPAKAEVVRPMLYGCATCTLCSADFESPRAALHKLLLLAVGFRRIPQEGSRWIQDCFVQSLPLGDQRRMYLLYRARPPSLFRRGLLLGGMRTRLPKLHRFSDCWPRKR